MRANSGGYRYQVNFRTITLIVAAAISAAFFFGTILAPPIPRLIFVERPHIPTFQDRFLPARDKPLVPWNKSSDRALRLAFTR